jgi:Reverse transcriptase (RNA-dependent DNA polymerase).
MVSKIEDIIEEDQFGFRKGKGTRDATGSLKIISERVLGVKEEMCLCFIEWQNAFDQVDWTKLLRVSQGKTDSVEIGREVRQGIGCYTILFNLYGESIMKEELCEIGNFKIGGRIINKVRFADNMAIIANTQEEL